jgi:hypothetical protein
MGIRWGPGVIVLALVATACVPTPAGRGGPAPGSAAIASDSPLPTLAEPTPTLGITHPTPLPSPPFTSYTVKKGDTLSSIAKHFGTTARSIAYWNRVTYPSLDPDSAKYKPNRLELGWVLQLIPHAQVNPEDLPTLSPKPTPSPEATASPVPSAFPSPTPGS